MSKGSIGANTGTVIGRKSLSKGNNKYKLTKDERKKIEESNKKLKEENKVKRNKQIKEITLEILSQQLETKITKEMIFKAERYKNYGNSKFSIRCCSKDDMIIRIKSRAGITVYKIIE